MHVSKLKVIVISYQDYDEKIRNFSIEPIEISDAKKISRAKRMLIKAIKNYLKILRNK